MPKPDFVIPFDRLPERFAEAVAHPPAVPAAPRPAATVVLLRDSADDMEVLLLRRIRTAGFVPGAYVFPGGRVDRTDAALGVVNRLDGLSAEAAERRLELPGAEPAALAYYLAAVREAFEETGILIGWATDGGAPATAAEDEAVNALRQDLMGDRLSFDVVLDRMGCRIDGGAMEYFAHWITPEPEPRRYDTRFFAAKVRYDARARVDPREMTDAVWLTPTTALRRHESGGLPMVFPTIKTLQRLSSYHRADEALATLGRSRVSTIMPRLVMTPTGVGMETDS